MSDHVKKGSGVVFSHHNFLLRNKKRLPTPFCLILFLIVPLGVFAEPRFPDNPAEGARLFSEKGCFRCHSILGRGGKTGHDLGRIDLGRSRLDMAGAMLSHAETMAGKMRELKIVWPRLTGPEIESLMTYLYYVNYLDEAGEAAKGERLFKGRGCVQCHAPSSRGAVGAIAVVDFPRGLTPIYLAKSLWNHGPQMRSEMGRLGIAWPQFEGTEIMDLLGYIRGVARGSVTTAYTSPGNPNAGERVFQEKGCTRCHGNPRSGAPDLADTAAGTRQSLTQVVARMWNHAPQIFARMRAIGFEIPRFTEQEMADLVSYIYFLNYFPPPSNAAAGRRLFAEKQCATCHAVGGGTQGVGPDLATSTKVHAEIDIVAAMWNHAPLMQTLMQERRIAWPTLKRGELNDLLGYIQSLRK